MAAVKQVIVARTDLGMGKGKLAAQVAHASLEAAEEARRRESEWFEEWRGSGQGKVVLKSGGQEELEDLHKRARAERLPCSLIQDRGLTQLEPGTVTCLGIGPAPSELIDRITGKLKLL